MRGKEKRFLITLLLLISITSYQLPVMPLLPVAGPGYSAVANYQLFAQDDLAQLKESYFKENQYSEFVDYLKDLKKDNPLPEVSYYIALSRYEQLGYLEQTQNWEEYFNRGEEYRQELISEARKAKGLTSGDDSLLVYTNCLLWQFHMDMQDEQQETALEDLLSAVGQHVESTDVDLSAVKYVADRLSEYGQRAKAQKVYNIYLAGLIDSLGEEAKMELILLAKELAYCDDAMRNPFFAEEVFKKIDQLSPDSILDESIQYLRAYNLEKVKQYEDAYMQYQILTDNYPQTLSYEEAIFKMGVISAYISQDIPSAQDYFTELIKTPSLIQQVFASLYQLGLISQYQGETAQAREYYSTLLERAKETSCGDDLVSRAKSRLKEIEENRALEFNLRTFMDASGKGQESEVSGLGVDIKVQHFRLSTKQDVRVSSFALTAESGCMPVNLEYLWCGDLGSAQPGNDRDNFTTHYNCPGTKLILLTVVTSSGILGHNLIFLDVE